MADNGYQLDLFNSVRPYFKIDKPIRLIELFAGIGAQAKALEILGVPFEHWKIYGGRKSQKTLGYYYTKGNQFVLLDYKREKVLSSGLFVFERTTKTSVEETRSALYNVEQDCKHFDNEMVAIPNAKPMTFEEMDELAKENKQWKI